MKDIIVIGPQRVGTNFITTLIDANKVRNLEVVPSGSRDFFWKHSLPEEEGPNYSKVYKNAKDAILSNKKLFVVLVSKHPAVWLESIRRNSADLSYQRKSIYQDKVLSPSRAIRFYAEYYKKWIDFLPEDQYLHMKYIDTLHNPEAAIKKIFLANGLETCEKIEIPNTVPFSTGNRSLMLQRYTNLEKIYTKHRTIIKNELSEEEKEIFHKMGYAL